MEEILLFKMYKEKSRLFIRSRNRKIFYKMLSKAERRLRSRKIPRCALHMPTESAGAKLYASRNDQAMITATGLNLTAFNDLHHSFKTIYDSHTPFTQDGTIMRKEPSGRGRKRIVDSATCLGLVLMWTRTRGSYVVLQMIFGLTQIAVNVYLRFGRRI